MKVKRVIVDEIPNYCRSCKFSKLGNDYLWCKLLETAVPPMEIHDDCPLELDTVTETDIQTVEQAPRIEKSSKETWQEMIDLLEKLNRKIASLPEPPESHGS